MTTIRCPYCNFSTTVPKTNCPQCRRSFDHSGNYQYVAAQYYEAAGRAQEALECYKKAAKEHNTDAMTRLGEMYEKGIGTQKNLTLAVYSHLRAAQNGSYVSSKWLEDAYGGLLHFPQAELEKARKSLIRQLTALMDTDAIRQLEELAPEDSEVDDDDESEEDLLLFDRDHSIHALNSAVGNITDISFPVRSDNHNDTDSIAVLETEQTHLDATIHEMEEWIDKAKKRLLEGVDAPDYTSQASLDWFHQEEYRIMSLREELEVVESNIEQPYFAHLFFVNDRSLSPKDVYVGNQAWVCDGQVRIVSHNSPLGQVAHRRTNLSVGTNDSRYVLQSRRMLAIRNRKVIKVVEDYRRSRDDTQQDGERTGSYDEFLLTILEERRGETQLADIVATIQENQNYIVTRPGEQKMIVQGCAGSGKSMIMLQRLQYLAYNRQCNLSDVIVLLPSEEYKTHIAPLITKLALSGICMMTVTEYYLSVIRQYYRIGHRTDKSIASKKIVDDSTDPQLAAYYYSDAFYREAELQLQPLKEDYRKRIDDYDSRERRWKHLCDVAIATKDVLPKKEKICGKKPKCPSLTQILRLRKRSSEMMKAEVFAELLKCYIIAGVPPTHKGKFFCIDEAQDLSPQEYQLLFSLGGEKSIFNLFGDCGQTLTNSTGIRDWNEIAQKIGDFSRYSLNESYRNTQEITEYINQTTNHQILAMGLHGNAVAELKSLREVFTYARHFGGSRMAVIVGGGQEAKEQLQSEWQTVLPADMSIYTVAEAKGLEFQAVIACDLTMDLTEKYIAYSRARERLFLYRPCMSDNDAVRSFQSP